METVQEIWVNIPDFPGYSVSNYGLVMNNKTEKLVKPAVTNRGVIYIPLYDSVTETKVGRSLKKLVARAFVDGETEHFDTPINKDGDKRNNHIDNLVWRPRWFAIKYSHQFNNEYAHRYEGPVYDTATNDEYLTVNDAAIKNGVLFREVFMSSVTGAKVWPTDQIFSIPHSIQVR